MRNGQIRKPGIIRPGSVIGVFSPSSGIGAEYPERWELACRSLASTLSVRVVEGEDARQSTGYTSGSPQRRAQSLMGLLLDPTIDGVIASIGGLNTNSMLDFLDWPKLVPMRKVVVGYSDATALLLALYAKLGLVTLHGPSLLAEFGGAPQPEPFTVGSLRQAICVDEPLGRLTAPHEWTAETEDWSASCPPRRVLEASHGWGAWQGGSGEGRLVGGNVETLNMLVGTPYLPDFRGALLFLEATGEEAYLPRFERALVHLRQAGLLDDIVGLIVGRCPDCRVTKGTTLEEVTCSIVGSQVPVAGEVDLGHTNPMLTLPIGCLTRLSVGDDGVEITVLESAVERRQG